MDAHYGYPCPLVSARPGCHCECVVGTPVDLTASAACALSAILVQQARIQELPLLPPDATPSLRLAQESGLISSMAFVSIAWTK